MSATASAHYRAADGVRGLACAFVVLFHCGSQTDLKGSLLKSVFQYGFGGIDLFFVLSAFCLALPILSTDRPFEPGRYLRRRFLRIFPPYWAASVLLVLLGLYLRSRGVPPEAGGQPFLLPPQWQWPIYHILLIKAGLLWCYWTLPLEWRWYFLLPLLALPLRRARRLDPLLLWGVSLVVALGWIALSGTSRGARLENWLTPLPGYLPVFVLGLYAADLTVRANPAEGGRGLRRWEEALIRFSPLGFALFSVNVLLVRPEFGKPAGHLLTFGPAFFFLMLAAIHVESFRRFFSHPAPVFLGVISYSLYLTHEPWIRLYKLAARGAWPALADQSLLIYGVLPGLCVLFAWGFHLLFERPLLSTKRVEPSGSSAVS